MPLGYLRRPLFLVLAAYIVLLAFLHARGVFEVEPPASSLRFRFYPSASLEGRVVSPLRHDFRGGKIVVRADRVEGRELGQKVLVYLPRGASEDEILPGRTVAFEGALRLPRAARNPGDFDERAFLADRGVAWVMKAQSVKPEPGPVPWRWLAPFWAERARRSVERSFTALLSGEEAALMAGLTLGYKGRLGRGLNRAVQDAGVMHLLVPSGAKQAFVMLACAALASALGWGVPARFLFSALVGGFYLLMAGGDPPYARAYLGTLALFGGWLADRDSGAFQALVLSALAILVFDPRALFSAGFQMTYLAMAGLVVAMPALPGLVPRTWPQAAARLAAAAAVTGIVELMLWPVFAGTFGRGSLVGALANLVLVPASGAFMAGGFAVWGLHHAGPDAALKILVKLLKLGLAAFRWICATAAALPWAAVDLSPMSASAVIVYYLLAFALLTWPRRRVSLGLALAAGLLWGAVRVIDRPAALRVVYLSLPRAQAALFTFDGRRHWLALSGGPAGTILRALKYYGISRLDRAVAIGASGEKTLAGISAELPVSETIAADDGWEYCEKDVCFSLAQPRVRRGKAEFGIIPVRLRRRAVRLETDGSRVRISDAL